MGEHTTGPDGLRTISDPRALQALAHPRRLDIFEALILDGPMTASQCAERVGDSTPSCSYHLRQLARFGFVERRPGKDARERPWAAVSKSHRFGGGELSPAQRAAAETLEAIVEQRRTDRMQRLKAALPDLPQPWQEVAESGDYALRLTVEEAEELKGALLEVLMRYQARTNAGEARPGSRLVRVYQWVLPDA